MKKFDITDDNSYSELYRFVDLNTLPAYVKEAEVLTKTATESLPDTAFADQMHRAFPINTAEDTYLSNAFFINKRAELTKLCGEKYINEVGVRIVKAAQIFDIYDDIANYNGGLDVKQAADYTEQSIVSIEIGGNEYDLFPYKTAEDLKFQASEFVKNLNNYPFNWRTKIASAFVEKAVEQNIEDLPDLICKYAGLFYPDTREFSDTLAGRMHRLSEEYQTKYQPIIEKAANISSKTEAFELCSEAYNIEKLAGVYEKPLLYREMGDLVDRTMTLDLTKIADMLNVVKIGGSCYHINDLQKVSKDIYDKAFDCGLDPKNANELMDVLPTVPRSDFELFKELSGITAL
jgi:hypothetical protein